MNFLSGKLTRLTAIAVLACATIALFADPAMAASKGLNGRYSAGELKSKCDANGGIFDPYAGDGGYSCAGSGGTVTCNDKGFCVGTCGKCAVVPKGIDGFLRPPASAGTASGAGGTRTKHKPPIRRVNQRVVDQHSGGARSGESKH